jgi:ligand-binding SRPBCC domain-containing protein
VLMKDRVKYKLPFGLIGQIAHFLFIKRKVENIFIYRKEILKKIFNHAINIH